MSGLEKPCRGAEINNVWTDGTATWVTPLGGLVTTIWDKEKYDESVRRRRAAEMRALEEAVA